MLSILARLLLVVGLAGFTAPVLAQGSVERDGVRIDFPADAQDWEEADSGWQVMFENEYGERGGAILQWLPAATEGSFAANFEQLSHTVDELADEDPIEDETGTTIAGYPMAVRYLCCDHVQDLMTSTLTAGVELPQGQSFLMLVMFELEDEQEDAVRADFRALVRSLRPAEEEQVAVLEPQDGAGGLDGAWTALTTGLMPNMFGGLDFTADNEVLVLDAAGWSSTVLPVGGTDLDRYCRAAPEEPCGTYRIEGGGLFGGAQTITRTTLDPEYGMVRTETTPFARDGEGIVLDDTTYSVLAPLPKDLRLDGTWRYFFASSGMNAMGSGSVAVERVLTLKDDGTFTLDGFAGVSSSSDMGGVTANSDRVPERGRYAVNGWTLRLTGSDGRKTAMSLFMPSLDDPDLLVIDGNNYLREDD